MDSSIVGWLYEADAENTEAGRHRRHGPLMLALCWGWDMRLHFVFLCGPGISEASVGMYGVCVERAAGRREAKTARQTRAEGAGISRH